MLRFIMKRYKKNLLFQVCAFGANKTRITELLVIAENRHFLWEFHLTIKKVGPPKSAILKGISDKNEVDFYGHFDSKKMSKNASTKSLSLQRRRSPESDRPSTASQFAAASPCPVPA